MRQTNAFIIFAISLLTWNCQANSNKVYIEIRHFAGAAGITLYYKVTDNYVQVDTDCDFQDCEKKTVYKSVLTAQQSDSLRNALIALKLDTLKKEYKPGWIVHDGLVSSIKIRGTALPDKTILIDNVDLPATDSLYRMIDKLILTKKYHLHYGEE